MSGRHAAPATDRRLAWPAARITRPSRVTITPSAAAGLGLIALLVLVCYAGPLVYHANLTKVNLLLGNRPPGPATRSAPTATDLTCSGC